MKFRFVILFALFIILILSCKRIESYIIITFDDSHVDEWFEHGELFNKYNIKSTFFISRPHQLSEEQIGKLKTLVADGHEIGCHGMNHIMASEENQYQYIETEIVPALQLLSDYGFTISSFAYPFGACTPYLDSVLRNYFTFIRKANYNYLDTLISVYPDIFTKKSKYCITDAMGIDENYNISMENLKDAILHAKKMDRYLVLYAHAINNCGEDYSLTPQYLDELFKLMKKNKVEAVTCRNSLLNH
jgi:peptidoglycan/xylan/chitin deacetylase (PgdA/CDA1 family)